MELLSHDILIVGGGGAGLRAAIAIGEENPKFQVGVISKVYPMRSHTVSAEMTQLEHWGCPWSREPDGHVAVRPFGGMKIERTWFAADKTGFHMLHALFQTSQKYNNITRYDEWFVTRLLKDDGRVQGVAAIELRTGQLRAIGGKT